MQHTFGGKDAYLIIHRAFDVVKGLVNAGENDFVHIHLRLFTDGQLTGAAHLNVVKTGRQILQ